jgi:hypothetical protein
MPTSSDCSPKALSHQRSFASAVLLESVQVRIIGSHLSTCFPPVLADLRVATQRIIDQKFVDAAPNPSSRKRKRNDCQFERRQEHVSRVDDSNGIRVEIPDTPRFLDLPSDEELKQCNHHFYDVTTPALSCKFV